MMKRFLACALSLLLSSSAWAGDLYDHGSFPATNSSATSSSMRAELDLIAAGFAKFPAFSGNGSKPLILNSGATGFTFTTGTLTLAGNFTISGAYATTLTVTGATNVTFPTTGTLATLSGAESLSTKTIVAPVLSGSVTGTYTLAGTPTISSPTITSPTITGTTSIGNGATLTTPVLSGSVTGTYTLAGTPTITAPAISNPTFSGGGTLAGSYVGTYTLAGTPTITAPAISNPTFSGGGTLAGSYIGTYTLAGTPTLTSPTVTTPTLNGSISGTSIAAQTDQETGTSTTLLVTPGRQKFHPSAAKAWVQFSANAGTITVNASYNVTSVVRNSAGNYTVTFTTAFSSIYYGYSLGGTANTGATGGGQIYGPVSSAPTTTTFIIGTTTTGTTPADWDYVSAIFMGDQ